MQPSSNKSPSGARNNLTNPLLSVAGAGYPFENLPENILLMPVTPATPAVLQDDPAPAPELDSFIGQQPPKASTPVQSNISHPGSPFDSGSQAPPQQPPPQKQGYFTSILSSLPNLSLLSISGDDSRSQPSLQQHQQHQIPGALGSPNPSQGAYNPNDYRGGYSQHQGVGDFNAGISAPAPLQQPPVQQQQPPPAALPPSGGAGSYRLGNQRRLKYAPPPDLATSNSAKQHYAPPLSAFPSQSNTGAPPTVFNPNIQPLNPNQPNPRFGSHSPSSVPTLSGPLPSGPIPSGPPPSGPIPSGPSPSAHISSGPPLSGPSVPIPSGTSFSTSISSGPPPSSLSIPTGPSFSVPPPSAHPFSSPIPSAVPSSTQSYAPFPSGPPSSAQNLGGTQPYAPILSGPPSSQESSLHSSFRSSPVATTPTTAYPFNTPPTNYNLTPTSGHHHQANAFATAPQSIPSRLPEPATPQNTPADVAFSGFNAYRQQQQAAQESTAGLASAFGFNEPPKSSVPFGTQLEAIKEATAASSDKTFTPISAAKVTEKLENLIAEQNEDAQSVKSELSAEVATITSKIPPAEESKEETNDELTEIDLNVSGNSDTLAPDNEVKFDIGQSTYSQQQSLDSFTVPSATSFFVNPPASNQNVPSFYNTTFQTQQPITDPFSFIQSPSSTAGFGNNAASLSGPLIGTSILNPGSNASQNESPRIPESTDNVDLLPQSIWGSSSQAQSHSTVLNPVYGTPVQSPPTFFNPAQLSSSSYSYPSTPSSTYAQAPIGSKQTSSISSSQSCQLPATSQESFNAVPEPTGSATLSPVQVSINPLTSRSPQETVPPSLQNLASGLPEKQMQYRPAYHHWFYRREVEAKILWLPFSMHDSFNLEEVHNSNEISPETKVATDGGRYDVEILRRQRSPVYWTGPVTEVRRCSWFYKGPAESRYTPYEESVAARLEEEFKQACTTNNWNRRVDFNNGEYIMFLSPTVQVHYLQATTPELAASWGNNSGSEDNAYLQGANSRPRVVKRGMDEFNIDEGEPERVDHLLFLVHGIGSVCDLKFRTVEEVVDEFRSISLQLVRSHYRSSSEQGIVNRIEVLPISWHATLHSGIDKKLQVITLGSIPKLRHFTNDTLLDILFYTSPIYCETIMQTVGNEMNRLYSLFNQRNPEFKGNVYLGGHSLGSLIMFDLLCHQKPPTQEETEANGQTEENEELNKSEDTVAIKPLTAPVLKRRLSKKVSYVMGTAGTGQPYINYPQLAFNPRAFFALGSPIGMFVTVRGIDTLGDDFELPTCPAFFNIFHPFDPVAYRVESLINPEAHKYRPMLIPHHKGRKRMHLELKETMARVGADLKQKLLESVRSTWNSVYQLTMFHKQDNQTLEQEIEKVVEEQMINPPTNPLQATSNDDAGADLTMGKLNGGRRIDYVLQEAPFEYINEYIFALTSHVCYWESEDTMLLILKEIYGSMGIQTDAQLPQQSLSIERVSTPSISSSPRNVSSPTMPYGIDPMTPITTKPVGPPPIAGFIRKS